MSEVAPELLEQASVALVQLERLTYQSQMDECDKQLIIAELQKAGHAALAEHARLTAEAEQAETDTAPYAVEVERLQDKLQQAQYFLKDCQSAPDSDNVVMEITAEASLIATQNAISKYQALLNAAKDDLYQMGMRASKLRSEAEHSLNVAAAYGRATDEPFTSALGQKTSAYARRFSMVPFVNVLIADHKDHPEYGAAMGMLQYLAEYTGMVKGIQRETARVIGDEFNLDDSGKVKHNADGVPYVVNHGPRQHNINMHAVDFQSASDMEQVLAEPRSTMGMVRVDP